MAHAYTTDDLTQEQAATLLDYAHKKGRYWKQALRKDWLTGKDANFNNGHHLRQIRNTLGPMWLNKVKLSN